MNDRSDAKLGIGLAILAAVLTITGCGGSSSDPAADAAGESPEPAASASAEAAGESSEPATSASGEAADSAGLGTDDVAYLSRLGLIRGHLRVGIELYRAGHVAHAQSHMKHPGDELYSALEGAFAARGAEGFADELSTLATAVEDEAAEADVDAAYEALLEAVARAESHVDSGIATDAAAQAAIVVNLLETAAEEYGIGVAGGEVTDVHEYQDAYGFTVVAGERAEAAQSRVIERSDHAVFQMIVDEIDALSRLWPELVPSGAIGTDPAELETGLMRIEETAADRL